ncbi:MAG TPA: putative metallopeptidase [Acidimicrobiales bacterium]|nr:putative metallopeptidase [Acidimicrobiales bacterium]
MGAVEYRYASEAGRIAGELIPEHHRGLIGCRIEFVFRSKATKTKGRVVLGSARKLTGLNAWLAGQMSEDSIVPEQFFVIELAEDEWINLSERQRRALVDHELSHCDAYIDDDGELKLSTRGHDLEEFTSIVERHGLWKGDVRRFVAVGAPQLDHESRGGAVDG